MDSYYVVCDDDQENTIEAFGEVDRAEGCVKNLIASGVGDDSIFVILGRLLEIEAAVKIKK